MSLQHKFNTLPFLDFDPDAYPIFFQHFDQKTEQAWSYFQGNKIYWEALARLPEENLLVNVSQSKINLLRLAQYKKGLPATQLIKEPDLHGNFYLDTGSNLSTFRLWKGIGKTETLNWVAELLGITVTYYSQPQTCVWDYSKPIGFDYCHLSGDEGCVQWLQHWIEPKSKPVGNSTLLGGYVIGSLFRPVSGANLVSVKAGAGTTNLFESSLNKAGFSRSRVQDIEPESANLAGFNVANLEERKKTTSTLNITPTKTTVVEGSGNNVASFSVDRVEDVEALDRPNVVGFSETKKTQDEE